MSTCPNDCQTQLLIVYVFYFADAVPFIFLISIIGMRAL